MCEKDQAPLTQNDNARRSISTFLILRPAELDHVFSSWMSYIDFTQNSISIICQSGTYRLSEETLLIPYVQYSPHRI
jgi:hypothetical protein